MSSSQAEDGMRNSRWLSLRCLYTRGSCTAVGHISVSRERGAPPKNQIECKNRINSSRAESRAMSARFAFVQTAPLPSLSLGTGRPLSLSLSRSRTRSFFSSSLLSQDDRMTPPRKERERGRSPPIFPLILLVRRAPELCAYEGSALFIEATFGHVPPDVVSSRGGAIREIISPGILHVLTLDVNEAVGINKTIPHRFISPSSLLSLFGFCSTRN